MRWLAYFILAYVAVAVHVGLSGYLNIGRAAPNLVLPVAVFVALNARREEALLGAMALGAMQDLFTQQPPGLYAFSYGLAALLAAGVRPAVHRDHPLTHAFVTLAAALLVGLAAWGNDWAYPRLHKVMDAPAPSIVAALLGALYTAVAAPLVLLVPVRIKSIFGFRSARALA